MVRKSEHMFEKMNITPLGLQILIFLARNPDKQFYLREIARILNKSVGGVHKTLKSLHIMGFVKENISGKNVYYRINHMNPSIKSFKIFMSINELNSLVNCLKNISEKIILFGSCVTGEDTIDSDIDLLILTVDKDSVTECIKKKKFDRKIQAVVVNATEFIKLKEQDKAFYQEINKGITLWDVKNE